MNILKNCWNSFNWANESGYLISQNSLRIPLPPKKTPILHMLQMSKQNIYSFSSYYIGTLSYVTHVI